MPRRRGSHKYDDGLHFYPARAIAAQRRSLVKRNTLPDAARRLAARRRWRRQRWLPARY